MEQIDQLKTMRDAAKERLEAAIRALETSPDAKLVNSLTTLIDDLEDSLGIKPASKPEATPTAKKDEVKEIVSDSGAAKAVEGKEVEPPEPIAAAETKTPAPKAEAKKEAEQSEEMSLEDSLEAELLGSDLGKS